MVHHYKYLKDINNYYLFFIVMININLLLFEFIQIIFLLLSILFLFII